MTAAVGHRDRPARRIVWAAAALTVALGLAAAGCASTTEVRVGADPAKVGPQTSQADELPTAQATAVYNPAAPVAGATSSGPPPSPSSSDPLAKLTTELTAALSAGDPAQADLTTELHPFAGNQLSITWTVSTDASDKGAPDRARSDARTLLGLVHDDSSLDYGSVVLTIKGTVKDKSGGLTSAKVVRAKYSQALVRSTDFPQLSLDRVFLICDDKPAEILAPFR